MRHEADEVLILNIQLVPAEREIVLVGDIDQQGCFAVPAGAVTSISFSSSSSFIRSSRRFRESKSFLRCGRITLVCKTGIFILFYARTVSQKVHSVPNEISSFSLLVFLVDRYERGIFYFISIG